MIAQIDSGGGMNLSGPGAATCGKAMETASLIPAPDKAAAGKDASAANLRNELRQYALKLRAKAQRIWDGYCDTRPQSANCAKLALETCAEEIEEIARGG